MTVTAGNFRAWLHTIIPPERPGPLEPAPEWTEARSSLSSPASPYSAYTKSNHSMFPVKWQFICIYMDLYMQILLRDLHITIILLTLRVAYCPLCSRLPSRQIVLHALYNLNLFFLFSNTWKIFPFPLDWHSALGVRGLAIKTPSLSTDTMR